jgi:hypothetical protein
MTAVERAEAFSKLKMERSPGESPMLTVGRMELARARQ